jgi:serine/threonine protein kinase
MLQKSTLPMAGAILSGQKQNTYCLLQLLGVGGAGSVFKAIQQSTGQNVALKLLHQTHEKAHGLTPECQQKAERLALRFERETTLCTRLNHPHIVNLLDKGQSVTGQLFAVFEFVPGETLKDFLARKGSLSAVDAGELMGQVLDAMACAHLHGIVHRDLKPHNIMVTSTGTRRHVKVLLNPDSRINVLPRLQCARTVTW